MDSDSSKTRVTVLQMDSRLGDRLPPYGHLSQPAIQKMCAVANAQCNNDNIVLTHKFIPIRPDQCQGIHPATAKIIATNEYLGSSGAGDDDFVVFLDTDAWIQNPAWLKSIIEFIRSRPHLHGAFSRDPPVTWNTYINSGSFIIRNSEFVRRMYEQLENDVRQGKSRHHNNAWPFDQHFISDFVYKSRTSFLVFRSEVMNTPAGTVLRHNWQKSPRMYADMNAVLADGFEFDTGPFDVLGHVDDAPYPNPNNDFDVEVYRR